MAEEARQDRDKKAKHRRAIDSRSVADRARGSEPSPRTGHGEQMTLDSSGSTAFLRRPSLFMWRRPFAVAVELQPLQRNVGLKIVYCFISCHAYCCVFFGNIRFAICYEYREPQLPSLWKINKTFNQNQSIGLQLDIVASWISDRVRILRNKAHPLDVLLVFIMVFNLLINGIDLVRF